MTANIQAAHETAVAAETLDYEFYSDDAGVRIYRLGAEKTFSKDDFKRDDNTLLLVSFRS